MVDTLGIGGQARSSSLIRNYLGFPRGVSGGLLARQAHEQAWVFGARFVFMQEVTDLRRDADRLVATLSEGATVSARAVVLATGVTYRRLGIPSLEALSGAGVFYGGAGSDAHRLAGQEVYVLGGANSAGQAALHLARYARRLTLVVRAPTLEAGMSHYLVRQLEATANIAVRVSTEIVGGGGDGWLTHLVLRDRASGAEETVDADDLYLSIGARPHTEWLPEEIARDERGFVLTGGDIPRDKAWPLERDPFPLETSMPGVLAIGDARHGSVKRVASAVGAGLDRDPNPRPLAAGGRPGAGRGRRAEPRLVRARRRHEVGGEEARRRAVRLGKAVGDQDHLVDALPRGGAVRVVELEQVAGGVPEVQLRLAAGQLRDRVAKRGRGRGSRARSRARTPRRRRPPRARNARTPGGSSGRSNTCTWSDPARSHCTGNPKSGVGSGSRPRTST